MEQKSYKKGFTLIEAIVYMALFFIIIGGAMVTTYGIIESVNAGTNHVILQEEANFLLRKVDWAMTGATAVTAVASPPSLSITKTGLPLLKFDVSGTNFRLTRGAGSPVILNSSSISLSNLSFTPTGGGVGVTTAFTLTTVQNGRNVSENFSTTKYLRK